jgi:benzoyl-CoA reductase/2-hydroxyglutaryl-CoA dehydratase subunit BcrC/BadD/HgdB
MLQLAASHQVEGVLVVIYKFCDVHGFDYHHVAQLFEGVGVPTQLIDVENVISPGQIRTRVQAFLEMLQPVEYMIEAGILPEAK